jgi:hypothetical protein
MLAIFCTFALLPKNARGALARQALPLDHLLAGPAMLANLLRQHDADSRDIAPFSACCHQKGR